MSDAERYGPLGLPAAGDFHCGRCGTLLDGGTDEPVAARELRAEVVRLRCALDAIANFDPFQGGPIAPRSTPTEQRMRAIAREVLSSGVSGDQP